MKLDLRPFSRTSFKSNPCKMLRWIPPREQIARPSAFATETSSSRGAVMMVWSQSEKRRKHHEHLWKQRSIPIGSVCMPYMVTSKPSIYPNFVSINLPLTYGSVMGYVIVSRRQRWQWRWPSPVSAARYPFFDIHWFFHIFPLGHQPAISAIT